MQPNCSPSRCALCGAELPRGVRVALFASSEAETPIVGDFCTVAHAFTALDSMSAVAVVPETLFLGVRVDRAGHDEVALAGIMAEIARRAVRAAMNGEETVGIGEPNTNRSHVLN